MRKADEILMRMTVLEEAVENGFYTMGKTVRAMDEGWKKKLDALREENEKLKNQLARLKDWEDQFNNLMTYNGRPQQ